ncbi:Clp protease N-terminal domain-containing protein [Streptomyces xiaopingdaonensis]|uniref:Clp protease N-terminal domain-containing protein n=1 Tax=Streptomyces xiaopingdaonensis TaxID=1565415 RepID=UPI0002E49A75|nr:Clp protease N-terminal domain-containing protein [Streptomyces xiaopingdaonensis]
MEQQTPDCKSGTTVEFEGDVFLLLLEAMRQVAKQERADVGTEVLLSALVSGDSAAGSAIAPGMNASSSLAVSIGCRAASVWISDDAEDGAAETPDDEREIDAFWRTVRQEEAKKLRRKNRKKKEQKPESIQLPTMTGALRSCLRKALESAREEGTVSVRVRHVARALFELPDTRAREAMTVGKLNIPAVSNALDALPREGERPEPGTVLILRKAGTFGKAGNPLTRKFTAWVFGGGAGFGSAIVGVVHSEARRAAVRRGASKPEPVDVLLSILALDRSLTVAGRTLPERLTGANQGAELLRRYGARQDAVVRVLLPSTGVTEEQPPEIADTTDFGRRLLHVAELTAAAQDSPTVGTTHLLAALLDETGTDAESAAEVHRVLTESGADVAGLREEPELQVPHGAGRAG